MAYRRLPARRADGTFKSTRRNPRKRSVKRSYRWNPLPKRSKVTGRFLRGNPQCKNKRLSGKYGPKPGKKRGGRVTLKRGPYAGAWRVVGCAKKGWWNVKRTGKHPGRRTGTMPKRVVAARAYRYRKTGR